MAYDKTKLYNSAVAEISLTKACHFLREKFKSENEFTENLLPKLSQIIKEAYGLTVKDVELEKVFDLRGAGYYKIRCDIYITTEEDQDIIIECKNPTHNKAEIFNSFSQLMSYQFMFTNKKSKPIFILATSIFDFMYFEFMSHFHIDIDIILNNKTHVGFWINDLNYENI